MITMKKKTILPIILWLLLFYFIPILGVVLYLFFGKLQFNKLRKKKLQQIWSNIIKNFFNINKLKNSKVSNSLFKFYKNHQSIVSGMTGNKIQLLSNYRDIMNKLIKDIKMAKNNINIIFYIWFPGGIADKVAISLIDAAKRGVHCRLILDSAGSINFFYSSWVNTMCQAGIEIVEALKINLLCLFIRRIDLRQHRKIIIIDNNISYTGSMNLIDPKIFKKNIGIGEWIDLMVRIKGPVTIALEIIFTYDWAMETGKHLSLPNILMNNKISITKKNCHQSIQAIASGPGIPKNTIHKALLSAIYSAKKKIIITTPYFVPSNDLLKAICKASCRGVDVSLIVPKNNDSLFVFWASKAFFDALLKSGVKIYQFYGGLLHSKSLLIDNKLSMIGTINFDMRSLWINYELTLFFYSTKFNKNLYCIQCDYMSNSELLDAKTWSNRAWKKKFFEKFFYFFSPFL